MIKNQLAGLMKQAQQMQANMEKAQEQLAQIIAQGVRLGVDYGLTVSCYQADEAGSACGVCDSCRLRRDGFAAAGHTDPTKYY